MMRNVEHVMKFENAIDRFHNKIMKSFIYRKQQHYID